jgi:hypothetical protein
VVAKVNDAGTPEFADDTLLSGAVFELRLDDGDTVYEPSGDDAPVLDSATSTYGFAVFEPPAVPGNYWITEVSAPAGFDIAEPLLVPYLLADAQRNCVASGTSFTCIPDDDLTGGLVLAFVADSPIGGELPSTDLPSPPSGRDPAVWLTMGILMLIVGSATAHAGLRRRRPSGRPRP